MLRIPAAVAVLLLCAGCASYTTPGGSIHLQDLGADAAEAAAAQPAPHFPANLGVVRVQAPGYKSRSSESYGEEGRYSVVITQELLAQAQIEAIAGWPLVESVTTLERDVLPPKLDSLSDLRLAAAKLQVDVLLLYTVGTRFQLNGKAYGPQAKLPLGAEADADSHVASEASLAFIDVRTGYVYGSAEAAAQLPGLAADWKSEEALDRKRLEAERQAFGALLIQAASAWDGITRRYRQ